MSRHIVTVIIILMSALAAAAMRPSEIPDTAAVPLAVSDSLPGTRTLQRPVTTPVDVDDEKPRTVLHYYDRHGDPLKEPVMFLATLDTVQKAKSKPVYPLYNGTTVGLNFGDLLFMAFGNRCASLDIHADVSLHNWFFPVIEAGIGFADETPSQKNFTYRVKPSFYAKAGVNYNFMYKSNPVYQVFLGLRAAFSHFSWDVKDVEISSDYWGEHQKFNMPTQRSTSFWGEALAGIKVKIVGNFSLGWTVRWHFPFHTSSSGVSSPWFVPGYGGSSQFAFTISAMWTIPAREKKPATGAESGKESGI